MTKKTAFLYVTVCLSMFVAAPPRLAYGIVLLLITNTVLISIIPLKSLALYLNLDNYKTIFLFLCVLGIVLFDYQLLILFSPVMALSLSFNLYLIPAASLITGLIVNEKKLNLHADFMQVVKTSGMLNIFSILFFILRELFGYGSLSFPGRETILVFKLPFTISFISGFFGSTIPAALILLAVFFIVLSIVFQRLEINRRADD